MEAVGNTPVTTPKFIKTFIRGIKAFGRGTWNFIESASRARAAEALWREGFHKEAKRLMLENK